MFVKATTGLKQFWEHFHTCTDPSIAWPRVWDEGMVPIGLHGDDCRFTETGQKVISMSLNFLLDDFPAALPVVYHTVRNSTAALMMLESSMLAI